MSKTNGNANPAAAKNETTRFDVFETVNNKIIEQLDKGIVPWQQPWTDAGIPTNIVSKKAYRGINIMLLSMLGYERNYFITYKQLQTISGKVKRDEKGHMVVYWNYVEKAQEQTEQTTVEPIAETAVKKAPILRYYTVFNIAQCENIPAGYLTDLPERPTHEIPECADIVKNMPKCPDIRYKEAKAFYNPLQDFVNMPKQKSFKSDESYYSTLFHELVHSTGHHNRLNRSTLIEMSEFGSDTYSHEELVAEIGTCYLQCLAGITGEFEQSAAYIQGWLAKLKNDKKFIFSASSFAQKAIDFILNIKDAKEDQQQIEE